MLPYNPLEKLNTYSAGPFSGIQLSAVVILLIMVAVYLFLGKRTLWHTLAAVVIGTFATYLTVLVTGYPTFSVHGYLARLIEFARSALHALGIS